MQSEWRDIPNYPRYEVSEHGQVRVKKNGRILAQYDNGAGRMIVNLSRNDVLKHWQVHRVVALAFIGECPEGMECCHNDGRKKNNHVDNLRYATKLENEQDKLKHGTRTMGETVPQSILTESKVRQIREMYASGNITQVKLAYEHNVSPNTIHYIIKRKLWKHVI